MALFRYTWRTFSRELSLILVSLVFFIPVYLLVTLSLKSTSDTFTKPLTFPAHAELGNYPIAWRGSTGVSLGRAMLSSSIITVGSVVGLIVIGSLCAYGLARRPSKMSTSLYVIFLIGVIVPFQLGVVPIYVMMRRIHLVPSYAGMILLNIGLLMPLTVFLYTGFVRTMPKEYEEAAHVDGAGLLRTFTRVVFPLLRPITGTVAVLTGVITWNEFFLPLIFLSGSKYQTLTVAVYSFASEYTTQWNYVFAAVAIAIAPILAFYLIAQRQLIRGFAGGIRVAEMARVSLTNVGKVYPDGTRAVLDLNLEVAEGEFTVLVGPSGCGKTTALRMVAGLEEITEGEIRIGDQVVNTVEPQKRDIAMVFQNYALYPHMSVYDNIAFPLRCRRLSKKELQLRVERTAKLLGLQDMLERKPRTLSGGQRQRVAMGRAIVREPQVFLMDEPLSNLDAKLRVQMRAEITKLQKDLGVTTLYVTHDQIEAMTMGSQIAVMRKGVLQQHGPAQRTYDNPTNLFVATFIGSPAMNIFKARLEVESGDLVIVIGPERQQFKLPGRSGHSGLSAYCGRDVAVGIRPEHVRETRATDAGMLTLRGEVTLVEALGAERLVHVEIGAEPVLTAEVLEVAQDIDAAAVQALEEEARTHKVPVIARFDSQSNVGAGQMIELMVKPDCLRFFDLESGVTIT